MITAIRIGNFKAFAEAQRIPIRLLTLIYGENSAGKSDHEPYETHERKIKRDPLFVCFVYFVVKNIMIKNIKDRR